MSQNQFSSLMIETPSSRTPTWPFVRRRFERFLNSLELTADQLADGETKLANAVACLNRNYWDHSSETLNRVPTGSYGKGTRVRPPRDIDFLFQLPVSVWQRYELRTGNRQSQLLQEVKDVLAVTNWSTRIRGDGQVVVVPYNTCGLEIVPAFVRTGGGYLICDTNDGGRYKWVDPTAELAALELKDQLYNGNVRKLTRILKQWQRYCDVPIKSFHIEALVMETLGASSYGARDEYWFDWLVRDTFQHMIGRADGYFSMPVTGEIILLGQAWLSKAQSAYGRACKACNFERDDYESLAGEEWQKIFGTMIPKWVTLP